jgi:hypothetical protein
VTEKNSLQTGVNKKHAYRMVVYLLYRKEVPNGQRHPCRSTHLNVNKDVFESKWKQIRAQSKVWWSLITDDDLNKVDKAPIKFDKYVTMLQVKYGYTRVHAREEINRRVTELKTDSTTDLSDKEKIR